MSDDLSPPERIYLQIGRPEVGGAIDPFYREATWHYERLEDNNVEYVRAERIPNADDLRVVLNAAETYTVKAEYGSRRDHVREAVQRLRATLEPSPTTKESEDPFPFRYSGPPSTAFWEAINASHDSAAYLLGCVLQDVEESVLTRIKYATRNEKPSPTDEESAP